MATDKTNPNWLFRGLIIISLLVHVVLFMHIAEIYRPKALSYIELTMRSISKPFTREIPRPRHRPKERVVPEKTYRVKTRVNTAPAYQPPPDPSPMETVPDVSQETVQVPQIPVIKGVKVSEWQSSEPAVAPLDASPAADPELTEEIYRDVVDRKIRGSVKYPSRAKKRSLQGKVTVAVTIGSNGEITEIKIAQSSGHRVLDRSVLKAVEEAAPFARPPEGPVTVLVPIVFKLI